MRTGLIETCLICDADTGRAGMMEDSLCLGDIGPFCEDCFDELMGGARGILEHDNPTPKPQEGD